MERSLLAQTKNGCKSRTKFYIAYTGLFSVLFVSVFSFILFSGRSFVWESDGFNQHLKALIYCGQWLRQLAHNLIFKHQLLIPEFDFNIGFGSDVVTTMHYYSIGDPLNLLSVFVPAKYMAYLYGALIFVRLYLSGLFFSLFCFNKGLKNEYGIIAGAFVYIFCEFALVAIRHPYFLNAMVYLPLLLIGVDRVLAQKRPYLLIITVGLATISNFYFLYILGVLTAVYTLVQLIALYRHAFKQIWKPLLKLAGCAALGIALGAVMLLPALQAFTSDNRFGNERAEILLYISSYYSAFPGSVFSSYTMGHWTCVGVSAVSIVAVYFLFMKKKQWPLVKIYFIIATIALLLPAAGKVLNGFSYPTNRWCFAFTFIVGFVLAAMWPQLMTLTRKDALILGICLTLHAFVCFIAEKSRVIGNFVPIVIGFISIVLLMFLSENSCARWKRLGQKALLAITMLGVFVTAYWLFAVDGVNYAATFMDYQSIADAHEYAPDTLIKSVSENDDTDVFFRYSGRSLPKNNSLLFNVNKLQYFWSLSNHNVADFQREISFREPMSQYWSDLDDRSALLSLACARYYLVATDNAAAIPYGLELITTEDVNKPIVDKILEAQKAELGRELTESEKIAIEQQYQSNYSVYENPYVLPLGYTYSSYITREKYDALTSLQKQEALLQTAVLEETPGVSLPLEEQLSITGVSVPYTVNCKSEHVTMQGNSFVVTKDSSTVELILTDALAGETYLSVNGLAFGGTSTYQLYNDDTAIDPLNLYTKTTWDMLTSEQQQTLRQEDRFYVEPQKLSMRVSATYLDSTKSITKTLPYHTPYATWYNARHDFDVNLGYYQEAAKKITIKFPSVGVYSFDSLEVVCQPMTNYAEQINALKADVLENVSIKGDVVTGSISLETPKLLCLAIPYSDGWTAYVDGEPAKLLQTNTMYMGLALTAGEHNICLAYKTPGLRLGLYVSAAAVVLLLGLVVFQESTIRKKQQKKMAEA